MIRLIPLTECLFSAARLQRGAAFFPALSLKNGHIVSDSTMKTTVNGVFAAGDCVGRPYQIARAVGQGNTAALSACEYLDKM